MKKTILKNRIAATIALLTLILTAGYVTMPTPWVIDLAYGTLALLSLGIAASFMPTMLRLVADELVLTKEFTFILGIVLSWTGHGIIRSWFWWWRNTNATQDWMLHHPIVYLATSLVILGGVIHLYTAWSSSKYSNAWIWIVMSAFAGALALETVTG